MTQDRSTVLSVTAALSATAAAGYYAYNQYNKRFTSYQQQLEAFEQVGGPPACSRLCRVGHQ
jgi:hypothetical protein